MAKTQKTPMVSTIEQSQVTKLLGVEFSVLLPRERSECVEILLERSSKDLAFPVHQHKECEQTYLVLEGEAEVSVGGEVSRILKGGVVYIPRLTDHSVRNVGGSGVSVCRGRDLSRRYLPNEPTWGFAC